MRIFILLFTTVIIISSCDLDSTDSDSDYFSTNMVFISRDSSVENGSGKEIQTLPSSNIEKVYFRSSDIEFWSIDDISDIDDLMSAAYHQGNEVPDHLNKSINVEIRSCPIIPVVTAGWVPVVPGIGASTVFGLGGVINDVIVIDYITTGGLD